MFQVSEGWLENEAQKLLKKITKKSLSDHDLHGGAYTGEAGVAYAVLRASSSSCFREQQEELLGYGRQVLQQHVKAAKKVSTGVF